jgi:hypothetical protein
MPLGMIVCPQSEDSSMTTPALETLEREKDKLYLTDAEMIRRLGVPEKVGYETIRALDQRQLGFPRKQKLWGDRRYWPAVKAWLDKHNGLPGSSML